MKDDKELIGMLQTEMRVGFALIAEGIRQTNTRLDRTIGELQELRSEMNSKLGGISSLLLSSEGNVGRLEKRIVKLEDRISRIEGKPQP